MKTVLRCACGIAIAAILLVDVGHPRAATSRLTQADFTYVGAFKLPAGTFGNPQDTFDYSGGFAAGNVYTDPAAGKSLFIKGNLSVLQVSDNVSVAQVAIPSTIKDPNNVGTSGLTTASLVRGFGDPSQGIGGRIMVGNGYGSLVAYGGKLIGTETTAYDGSCQQTTSAWVSGTNFSSASGPYAFTESVSPRLLGGGFMALVPSEWQSALGRVVSGNGPASISGCASNGPSLHAIDADALVKQPSSSTKIASSPLVYYTDTHPTLGVWNSNSPNQTIGGVKIPSITVTDPHGRGTYSFAYYENSARIQGVLFADGTSSVLFFGHKGLGPYCYGIGSDCGDRDYPQEKGDHAYPYSEFVWAYDVNDLIAVKQGKKQPWDVVPYTGWAFKVFGDGDGGRPVGVAWDPQTRLAYMIVARTNGTAPLVHVFRVGGGTTVTVPAPPANVRVIG